MRSPRLSPRILKLGVLATIVFACSEPTAPRDGSLGRPTPVGYAISDAMHADGNRHVFFLPPMVATPHSTNGRFDPNVAVEIDICELTSAGCLTPFFAQFSRVTGSGSEMIRVDGDQYIVNWHTDRFPVSANKTYRIRLRVLSTILGFADVQVFTNSSQAKNAVTGETFALVDGRTLPIKFRIEEGAVYVFPISGGKATSPDGKVEMEVPEAALKEPMALTVAPAPIEVPDDQLVNGAVYEFGPNGTQFEKPIKVTIRFAPEDLPPGQDESRVRLHTVSTGVDGQPFWEELKESSVDVVNHMVTGLMEHFTPGGAKGQTAVSTVSVSPVPPGSVFGTKGFTYFVYPKDAVGNFLKGRTVSATSSSPSTLTTSVLTEIVAGANPACPNGCYTGSVTAADVAQMGSATVTATSENMTTAFTVSVNPMPIQSVSITPLQPDNSIAMRMYETRQLGVTLKDIENRTVTNRQLTWTGGGSLLNATPMDPAGYTLMLDALLRGTATLQLAIQGSSTTASATVRISSPPAARLVITPSQQTIPFGNARLELKAYDARDVEIPDAPITWTIGDRAVAEMDPVSAGAIAVLRPLAHDGGTTAMTAVSEQANAAASVTFLPEPVNSVVLSPSPLSVQERAAASVSVITRGASGAALSGRAMTVTSDDESVASATPNPAGATVTGAAPGTTTLRAVSEGISGAVSVTVTPLVADFIDVQPATPRIEAGATAAMTMTAYNSGAPLNKRWATWSSDNNNIATVDAVTGVIRAVHMGTANITATVANVGAPDAKRTVAVNIVAPPFADIVAEPIGRTVLVGETTRFAFKAIDTQGNPLSGLDYDFISQQPGILRIVGTPNPQTGSVRSGTGQQDLLGLDEGNAPVLVTVPGSGVAVEVTFEVRSPVDRVTIQPADAVIGAGRTVQLSAVPYDAAGVQLPYPISWSSANGSIATVSASGLVTGVADGTVNIIAESRARRATVSVKVASVATIQLAKAPGAKAIITERDPVQYVATLKSSDDLTLSGRAIDWSMSDPNVATVDNDGLVTPRVSGTVLVRATSEGVTGSIALTIISWQPVAAIVLQPSALTVEELSTATVDALTRAPSGTVLTDRLVTWQSLNPSILSASATPPLGSSASITGVAPGSGTVRATSEQINATVQVTVAAILPDRFEILPANPTVAIGKTNQLSSYAYNADRPLLERRTVWYSTNQSIATVDQNGVVRGNRMGTVQLIADFYVTATGAYQGQKRFNVTVVAPPVGVVILNPPSATVFVGEPFRYFSMNGIDPLNYMMVGLAFDVTPGDASCMSIPGYAADPATGTIHTLSLPIGYPYTSVEVVGLKECNTTLSARVSGTTVSKEVPVSVQSPIRSISFSPANPSIAPGGQVQLSTSMIGYYGGAVSYPVTWSSENPAIATVDNNGVVRANAVGETKIIAESRGRRAENLVTVARPATLEITTSTPSITHTQFGSYTATLKTVTSSTLLGATVQWSTSDPNVATIDASGLVTAHSIGQVTVTGTSDGVSGSANLDVTVRWNMSTTEPTPRNVLYQGQYLQSRNGQYWLVMQADCNLVLYRGTPGDWSNSVATWGSGTQGRNRIFFGFSFTTVECMTVMQGDGNLVIYRTTNPVPENAVWGSGVRYNGNFHISVEDDGRFMLWEGAGPYSRGQAYFSFPF